MSGRRWATGAFLVGIAMSVYGNVAHVLIRSQNFGAILFSSFWPVAVFLSIEVMARVKWPTGHWWALARFGGLGLVAAVAAITSYTHLSALLTHYGEVASVAKLGPLAPDGLMVIAAAAMQATTLPRGPQTAGEALAEPGGDHEEPPEPVTVSEPPSLPAPAPAGEQDQRQTGNGQRGKTGPQAEARAAYVASVTAGKPLSGEELGKRYSMSGRWGRDRIREVREAQPV